MKYLKLFTLLLIPLSLSFCTNKPAETDRANKQSDSSKVEVSEFHIDTVVTKDIFSNKDKGNPYEVSFGGINTTLFADAHYLKVIQLSKDTKIPLIITYDDNDSIIFIKSTKTSEKGTPVTLPKRGLSKSSLTKGLKPLLPYISKDSIRILFDYFKSITCQGGSKCADDNICLTFKYKTNGCFARAHWMKKIIEDDNHYHSAKIFSFGALRVNNISDCDKRCVNWGWHVAPIVFTMNGSKTDTTVIDPSISDSPVTISAWLDLQKVQCKRGGYVNEYEIVPSDHYSYDNGDYIYDTPDYSYTKGFLNSICGYCAKVRK